MPDWLPYAWAICGIVSFGGMLLGELIFDEKITLNNLLLALVLLALGPLGLVVLGLTLVSITKDREIVLYRRKKEPLPDLPPGEEALLEPVITPYHRASDALLTPHKEPSK